MEPMRNCQQTEGMTILDHGMSVRSWYEELKNILVNGAQPNHDRSWVLPGWITDDIIKQELGSLDDEIMWLYQVFHDCGKPQCLEIDDNGQRHFPNHAAISKETWLKRSDGSEKALAVAELIGMDMDAHLLKTQAQCDEFASRPQAIALLITAICEIHSNAQMFGGIESEGFKIKSKRLYRNGFRVLRAIVAQRKSRGF